MFSKRNVNEFPLRFLGCFHYHAYDLIGSGSFGVLGSVARLICLGHMATSACSSPDTRVHEADSLHVEYIHRLWV